MSFDCIFSILLFFGAPSLFLPSAAPREGKLYYSLYWRQSIRIKDNWLAWLSHWYENRIEISHCGLKVSWRLLFRGRRGAEKSLCTVGWQAWQDISERLICCACRKGHSMNQLKEPPEILTLEKSIIQHRIMAQSVHKHDALQIRL